MKVCPGLSWLVLVVFSACGSVSTSTPDGPGGDGAGGQDFSVATESSRALVRQAGMVGVDVTVTRTGGHSDAITITVTDLPTGVTASPLTIAAGASTGTLMLSAAAAATQGGTTVTVTGTAGTLTRDAPLVVLVAGAPGTLDQTFASGGTLAARLNNQGTVGRGMRIQPDRKIVVAAATNSGQAALLRLNEDGAVDDGFGAEGFVSTGMGTTSGGLDLEVTDNGIVVGGWSGFSGDTNYTMFAYTPQGVLATDFGAGGIATLAVPGTGYAEIHKMLIDIDGTILAVGSTFSSPFLSHAMRYDGASAMLVFFDTQTGPLFETALQQPDGKLLVAGNNAGDYWIGRYDASGALDATFDGDGVVSTDHGGATDNVNGLALVPGGKILAIGISAATGMSHVSFAQYNSNGSLDLTFGTGGKVVAPGELSSRAPTFAVLDGQGRIVVAGYLNTTGQPIAVARFMPDGMPDATFGTDGLALIDFGLTNGTGPSGASAFGVALDEVGRIVISAQVGPSADGSVGVARLWP